MSPTADTATRSSLMLRLRDKRDHVAWSEFDRRYGELLLRYCVGCGLQLSDAEDARQMVLLSLTQGLDHFNYDRDKGRFRSYLAAAARHAVERIVARQVKLRAAAGRPAPLSAGVDHGELWEQEWMNAHYRAAVAELRSTHDPQGLAVFDGLLQGESSGEIASRFGMSEVAIRKVKQRVRERLSEIVSRRIRAEDRAWS
jgi:RNA polymerase sigma-70 factor, ECF subfamily